MYQRSPVEIQFASKLVCNELSVPVTFLFREPERPTLDLFKPGSVQGGGKVLGNSADVLEAGLKLGQALVG